MRALNAISVDVEDYFHTEAMTHVAPRSQWDLMPSRVVRNTGVVLDEFAEKGVRATFFFLGWVAERFPFLVRRAVADGHEIGCHSYWHRAVFTLSESEFREDTCRAKDVIEHHAQKPLQGYRAPSFSITPAVPWAFDVLEDLGFTYDSSVNPIRHGFYGNASAARKPGPANSGNLVELPIATWNVGGNNLPVGGGAYLRILPYTLMRSGLNAINQAENMPAVVYFHPWEIDADQPRLKASLTSRMRQYIGLSGMRSRLRRLMDDYEFAPINEAFSEYLPAAVPPARSAVAR